MFKWSNSLLLSMIVLISVGCAKGPSADDSSDGFPLFGSIGTESSACASQTSYGTFIELQGTASFETYTINNGLRFPILTKPIRGAEVVATNSSGTVVQCGRTSATGDINLRVPKTAGTVTVTVKSRGATFTANMTTTTVLQASVLNNSTSMTPYTISTSISLAGTENTTQNLSALVASATTTALQGGAFNILDQLYESNLQIRDQSECTACQDFEAAPKVRVFWSPGLSPGAYYGEPTTAISFFIRDAEPSLGMASGIYMMGGVNGSVCADTDHFDNSVIIHEYGHFLEKAYAGSDSPGGSHNGNSIIDPRLAWSEGWSNYLQAFVRNSPEYVDTIGHQGCAEGTSVGVHLDIGDPDEDVPNPTYPGEGVFREVSVARQLWDATNLLNGGAGASSGFASIWAVFSDTVLTTAFPHSSTVFRNMGLFNEYLAQLVTVRENANSVALEAAMDNEVQVPDPLGNPAGLTLNWEYGKTVTAQGATACTQQLQAINNQNNQIRSNDYWAYYYNGNANRAQIRVTYTPSTSGTGGTGLNRADLHLYVYPASYTTTDDLPPSSSMYSARAAPESGVNGEEVISLSGQSPGWYLINVYARPGATNQVVTYQLSTASGTENLCP